MMKLLMAMFILGAKSSDDADAPSRHIVCAAPGFAAPVHVYVPAPRGGGGAAAPAPAPGGGGGGGGEAWARSLRIEVSVGECAEANVGISSDYIGASAGASLAEVKAGPFEVRAGLKFGAAIESGVPKVDLGPVSAPCACM